MSTQAFERYSRYEPHIAEGLTQMFVNLPATPTNFERGAAVAQFIPDSGGG